MCMGGRRRDRAATSTPSHPNVPGWTTPTTSGYLHTIASLRAWVDDADTEQLPPLHRIRPRERLPDPEYCPREHISDKENFRATSSPLLRQELLPRREIINTEVSFWHLSNLLSTDDCSSATTPTVTIVVSTASVSYFRLYILYLF